MQWSTAIKSRSRRAARRGASAGNAEPQKPGFEQQYGADERCAGPRVQNALGRGWDHRRALRLALFPFTLILLSGEPLSGGAALPKRQRNMPR